MIEVESDVSDEHLANIEGGMSFRSSEELVKSL